MFMVSDLLIDHFLAPASRQEASVFITKDDFLVRMHA